MQASAVHNHPTWEMIKDKVRNADWDKIAKVSLAVIFAVGLLVASIATFGAFAGIAGAGYGAILLKGFTFGAAIGLAISSPTVLWIASQTDNCAEFLVYASIATITITALCALTGLSCAHDIAHEIAVAKILRAL